MKRIHKLLLFILIFALVDFFIFLIISCCNLNDSKLLPNSNVSEFSNILFLDNKSVLTQEDYKLTYDYNENQPSLEEVFGLFNSTDYKRENIVSSAVLWTFKDSHDILYLEIDIQDSRKIKDILPAVGVLEVFEIGNQYYLWVNVYEDVGDSKFFDDSNAFYKVNNTDAIDSILSLCNGQRKDSNLGSWMPYWLLDIIYGESNPVYRVVIAVILLAELLTVCVLTVAPWKKSRSHQYKNRNADDILKNLTKNR